MGPLIPIRKDGHRGHSYYPMIHNLSYSYIVGWFVTVMTWVDHSMLTYAITIFTLTGCSCNSNN